MANDSITVTDNRTGKTYEIPIENGAICAMDLRKIKVKDDDFGLMTYDPAFQNTASCKSRVTFIDGDRGILRYRGYPIEELAEQSTYLETAYLIVKGELRTPSISGCGSETSPTTPWSTRTSRSHGRIPLRRSPDGNAGEHDRGALDVLPGSEAHQ